MSEQIKSSRAVRRHATEQTGPVPVVTRTSHIGRHRVTSETCQWHHAPRVIARATHHNTTPEAWSHE